MHVYIPGAPNLIMLPVDGLHPTFTYNTALDSVPGIFFQTPDSVYRGIIAANPAFNSAEEQTMAHTRQVNSISIEGKPGSIRRYNVRGTGGD